MIGTVTANPAIDRTIFVNGLKIGSLNEILSSFAEIGGKGINVAKNLSIFEDKVLAILFIGPNTKNFIDYLKSKHIDTQCVEIKNEIRTNIKIVDVVTKEVTELNEVGPNISEEEIDLFKKLIFDHLKVLDVLVLSGSLPRCFPVSFYKDIVKIANRYNIKVILDSNKDSLFYGMQEGPFMIKPNKEEFEYLTGKKLLSLQDIYNEAKKLLNIYNIKVIAVTLGSEGSIVVTRDKAYRAYPLKVEVFNTVGAGDAFVAGFAYGIHRSLTLFDTLKLAAALSSYSVMKKGEPLSIEMIEDLKESVKIELFY